MSGLQQPTAADIRMLRGLTTRRERDSQGLFLAEGEHLVQEAIREGLALYLLVSFSRSAQYAAYASASLPLHTVPDRVFSQLSDTRAPQGILAVCRLPDPAMGLGPRIVALNGVQDPGNVGTILRTADAAGFTGVLLDAQCADFLSAKALRASMGSAMRVPVQMCEDLPAAVQGLTEHAIIAASLDGEGFYGRSALPHRLCLLVGSEGAGLSGELLSMADHVYRLPMMGRAESLNAAVAASIMMYDFLRVRAETGENFV